MLDGWCSENGMSVEPGFVDNCKDAPRLPVSQLTVGEALKLTTTVEEHCHTMTVNISSMVLAVPVE
jgi:hypothetical protein